MRAGNSIIIAGITAWVLAGLSVMYVVMQANHVMALRADILKAEALKPTVPVIASVTVENAELDAFAKTMADLYPQLNFVANGNRIEIRSGKTDMYGAFREAVGHMFNGGQGWRVNVEELCVGRECKNNTALFGNFSINRLRVDKPAA